MDRHGVENLELSAIQALTGFLVTYASIIAPDTSKTLSRSLLWRTGRSATLILFVHLAYKRFFYGIR